jgi:dynein light chain Tctex-type 1
MEIVRGEETSFAIDEVSDIVKETIERLIGGHVYQQDKVNRWVADVVDQVLTALANLGKPFKYIVQTVSD